MSFFCAHSAGPAASVTFYLLTSLLGLHLERGCHLTSLNTRVNHQLIGTSLPCADLAGVECKKILFIILRGENDWVLTFFHKSEASGSHPMKINEETVSRGARKTPATPKSTSGVFHGSVLIGPRGPPSHIPAFSCTGGHS